MVEIAKNGKCEWVSEWVSEWVTKWVNANMTSREAIASKNIHFCTSGWLEMMLVAIISAVIFFIFLFSIVYVSHTRSYSFRIYKTNKHEDVFFKCPVYYNITIPVNVIGQEYGQTQTTVSATTTVLTTWHTKTAVQRVRKTILTIRCYTYQRPFTIYIIL